MQVMCSLHTGDDLLSCRRDLNILRASAQQILPVFPLSSKLIMWESHSQRSYRKKVIPCKEQAVCVPLGRPRSSTRPVHNKRSCKCWVTQQVTANLGQKRCERPSNAISARWLIWSINTESCCRLTSGCTILLRISLVVENCKEFQLSFLSRKHSNHTFCLIILEVIGHAGVLLSDMLQGNVVDRGLKFFM
jgi:hypothetical protein